MANTKNHFDTLIIGGGLAGLIAAQQTSAAGKSVALVESDETLGGSSKTYQTAFGETEFELKFLPNFKDSEKHLLWLGQILQMPLGHELVEVPALTFDSGTLKTFVGFGNDAPKSHHEVNYYSSASQWKLEKTPRHWVNRLKTEILADVFARSTVTGFKVEEQNIVSAVINGSNEVSANEFIWTAPPMALKALLAEHIPPRIQQKLAKGPYFASIHLDMIHESQITDSQAMHILQGGQDDPLVGRFQMLGDSGKQLSQWAYFIPSTEADNEELIAAQLKYMKRQISRAYAQALENKISERLVFDNYTHGRTSLELSSGRLPKPANLRICHPSLSASGDLLGCLENCYEVFASAAAAADEVEREVPALL